MITNKKEYSKYIQSGLVKLSKSEKLITIYDTIIHKIKETSFIKFYAEQSSLLLNFRLKLKTSLRSFNSLSNEFHIFTVL